MITHELAKIYVTSDGKKFIDEQKAIMHERYIQKERKIVEELYERYKSEF